MESWPFFILALRVPREGTAAFADDDSETVPGLGFAPKLSSCTISPFVVAAGSPLWTSQGQWTYETLSPLSLALGSPVGQSPLSERLPNKGSWTHAPSKADHRAPCIEGPWLETVHSFTALHPALLLHRRRHFFSEIHCMVCFMINLWTGKILYNWWFFKGRKYKLTLLNPTYFLPMCKGPSQSR